MEKEYTLEYFSFASENGITRKYNLSKSRILHLRNEFEVINLESAAVKNLFMKLENLDWDILFKQTQDLMIEGAPLFRVKTPCSSHQFKFFLDVNYKKIFGCKDEVITNLQSLEEVFVELKNYTSTNN